MNLILPSLENIISYEVYNVNLTAPAHSPCSLLMDTKFLAAVLKSP